MARIVATAIVLPSIVLVAVGAATSAAIRGTDRGDRLQGTPNADTLYGRGGADVITAGAGADLVNAGPEADRVLAGSGADRVVVHGDRSRDSVRCGGGHDVVTADPRDGVARDCEVVSRQLSRDPYTNPDVQHETEVEPDSFAAGSTVVTAFQAGRATDGGASNIGFATSSDAGRSWRSGFLPALTVHARPRGTHSRASDPVVAYDALHRVWLIASLGLVGGRTELLVSRSADGVRWSGPIVAAGDRREEYDKEWIACDNGNTSPFRGRCYLAYLDARAGHIATRSSNDGGLTWSQPVAAPTLGAATMMNGVLPVVRPDGTLILTFAAFAAVGERDENQIAATRSTDGGATFSRVVRVAELQENDVAGMRAPPLPTADVDADGTVYVAWQDCRFRSECGANGIVMSRSRDGVAWSPPRRVPVGEQLPGVDYFLPGLAVAPATSAARARIALVYHALTPAATVDVRLVTSLDGGATWTPPQRLNAESMRLTWIARTRVGRMLGDYVSVSFVGGRAVPAFSLASAPVGGSFRQAIFATTRGGRGA